jgi:RHS repeat-associated protein
MTYNELNHVLLSQDRAIPDGNTLTTSAATSNVYDGAGRVVCVERLSGVVLAKQSNSSVVTLSGAPKPYQIVVSGGGTRVSFTRSIYDLDGRVTNSMAANGTVTEYDYDADGRRTKVLVYTNYTADLSSINSKIAPGGDYTQTQYKYDPSGNQIAMIDANGNETDYQYDSANRMVLTTYPQDSGAPSPTQTATLYDGLGNKTRTIDEAGVPTAFTYDYRGLVTSVTLDAGSQGQLIYLYGYDEMGNLIKQTDANGNVTQFQYDQLGRRTQRMLPDGSIETTAYADVPLAPGSPVNVQQTAVTDFRGRTIVATDDVMNRLATKVLPAINPGETITTIVYSYTPGGQVSQVQTSTNGTAIRTEYYAYDSLNRLAKKDVPEGVLAYTWTPDSHVQTINAWRRSAVAVDGTITNGTVPDVSLGYGYDYLGRLAAVTNNTISAPNVTSYAYDPVGNLAGYTYPTGMRHSYAYNQQNRLLLAALTNGSGSEIQSYRYALNPVGYRTNVIESMGTSIVREINYGYDTAPRPPARVYRLTSEAFQSYEDVNEGWMTYAYDAAGNRTNRTASLAFTPVDAITNQAIVFDHRDLIDSDSIPNNANPNYDANGNTLVDNGVATGDLYDAENRLIATGHDAQAQYAYMGVRSGYDAEGNRVSKTVGGGGTTLYLVDDQNPTGYPQVLAEYESNVPDQPSMSYVYGLGLISQKAYDDNLHYYAFDGQGSVRMLLDDTSSANVVATYEYDGYGDLLASSGTVANNYRYTGQQWDPDSGMYHLGARDYKPSLGRFWTADTFQGDTQDPLSLHKYLYCQANPVNGNDPTGHDFDMVSMMTAAGVGESLETMYNAGVTITGNSLKNTIIGVQQRYSVAQIVAINMIENVGPVVVGAAVGAAARYAPGIVKGIGQFIQGGRWLRGTQGNAAFIPEQVGVKLVGQKFANFDEFRAAFWKLVGEDANISSGFSAQNVAAMKKGYAPTAPLTQQVSGRMTYELHHITPIQHGGEVYNLDNMIVCTPRYQKEVLEPAYHY